MLLNAVVELFSGFILAQFCYFNSTGLQFFERLALVLKQSLEVAAIILVIKYIHGQRHEFEGGGRGSIHWKVGGSIQ